MAEIVNCSPQFYFFSSGHKLRPVFAGQCYVSRSDVPFLSRGLKEELCLVNVFFPPSALNLGTPSLSPIDGKALSMTVTARCLNHSMEESLLLRYSP